MAPTVSNVSPSPGSSSGDSNCADSELQQSSVANQPELRNFSALAAHQILLRTGWIFKTESIVMPAVLDSIAGAGWVRGWLPLLNRVGHSLPPLLMARRIKVTPRKKSILLIASGLMSGLFLTLSMLFTGNRLLGAWTPLAFLVIYTLFFMCIGISQVAFSTLQGKLVAPRIRGRLLLIANVTGAVTAVTSAYLLLPGWLQPSGPRFDLVFGFAGVLFAVAAAAVLFVVETADNYHESPVKLTQNLLSSWLAWRRDRNFRRLTAVAALFGCSMMLFPHYQNLGLKGMRLELNDLVLWVIVQNIGTGVFSIPAGQIADRRGNRLVLLITMLGIATAPVLAISLSALPSGGGNLFPIVFVFVGLTPVVLRTLQNFTLELCSAEDHPRYLSTLAVCVSLPVLLSPLVGLLIDIVGFGAVFLAMAAVVLFAWWLCFGLVEPREHVTAEYLPPVN